MASSPQEPEFWNELLSRNGPDSWPGDTPSEKDWLSPSNGRPLGQCTPDDIDWAAWTQVDAEDIGNILGRASPEGNLGVVGFDTTAGGECQPRERPHSKPKSLLGARAPWNVTSTNSPGGFDVGKVSAQHRFPYQEPARNSDPNPTLPTTLGFTTTMPVNIAGRPPPPSPPTNGTLPSLNRHPDLQQQPSLLPIPPPFSPAAPPNLALPKTHLHTSPAIVKVGGNINVLKLALKQQSSAVQLQTLIESVARSIILQASKNALGNPSQPRSEPTPSNPPPFLPETTAIAGPSRPHQSNPPTPTTSPQLPHLPSPSPNLLGDLGKPRSSKSSKSSTAASEGWSPGSCPPPSPLLPSDVPSPLATPNSPLNNAPAQQFRNAELDSAELSRLLASVRNAGSDAPWPSSGRQQGRRNAASPLAEQTVRARGSQQPEEDSYPSESSRANSETREVRRGGSGRGWSGERSARVPSPMQSSQLLKEESEKGERWDARAERRGRKRGSLEGMNDEDSDGLWKLGLGGSVIGGSLRRKGVEVVRQQRSEVFDLVQDGHQWRKYGQKELKGQRSRRSYYKCSHHPCKARKQVQTDLEDEQLVMTTYDGDHCHEMSAPSIPIYVMSALKGLLSGKRPECPVEEENWFQDMYGKLAHELEHVLVMRENPSATTSPRERCEGTSLHRRVALHGYERCPTNGKDERRNPASHASRQDRRTC